MIAEMTREERARQDFVAGLMTYNSTGLGRAMADFYHAHAQELGPSPSMQDVAALMGASEIYPFAAFFERHNHAMSFRFTRQTLERQRARIESWLDDSNRPEALGSLELDPNLKPPAYYRKLDIHQQPGNYHGEFAGFLYHWMIDPFLAYRDTDNGMGYALATGVPKSNYRRILDLGCGIGKSTQPYCDLYPDAEVHGLDYAASMLKYGHRWAESLGKKIHFHQRLAESPGFEDESFDLITAVWLFHEIPKKSMAQVVAEAYRLLRPGGVFAFMESPPFKELNQRFSPLSEFLLDSTARRMADPYIISLFSLDRQELMRSGGFTEVWEEPLPNKVTGYGTDATDYFFGAFPWWMTAARK